MKRTTLMMILALGLFAFIPKQVSAGDLPDFELIKGQVIDEDGNGKWDYLTFSIETKNAKDDIFVKSVNIKIGKKEYLNIPTSKIEINKRIDDYITDLSDLNIAGSFQIEIVLDISELIIADDVVDSGPGSNPNETIIIIDYP